MKSKAFVGAGGVEVALAGLGLTVSLIRELRIAGVLDARREREVLLGAVGTLRNILHIHRRTAEEAPDELDFSLLFSRLDDMATERAEAGAEQVLQAIAEILANYHHLPAQPKDAR